MEKGRNASTQVSGCSELLKGSQGGLEDVRLDALAAEAALEATGKQLRHGEKSRPHEKRNPSDSYGPKKKNQGNLKRGPWPAVKIYLSGRKAWNFPEGRRRYGI